MQYYPPIIYSAKQDNFKEIQTSAYRQINNYRYKLGLNALFWDKQIYLKTRTHSINMALGNVPFGHSGFDIRSQQLLPWLGIAENVHQNKGFSDPATQAVTSWINSPEHYKNITGDYTHTAIGVSRAIDGTYYFTQIFLKR